MYWSCIHPNVWAEKLSFVRMYQHKNTLFIWKGGSWLPRLFFPSFWEERHGTSGILRGQSKSSLNFTATSLSAKRETHSGLKLTGCQIHVELTVVLSDQSYSLFEVWNSRTDLQYAIMTGLNEAYLSVIFSYAIWYLQWVSWTNILSIKHVWACQLVTVHKAQIQFLLCLNY